MAACLINQKDPVGSFYFIFQCDTFREVIEKRPEEFKIMCLKQIRSLFPEGANPFHAGFGNKSSVSGVCVASYPDLLLQLFLQPATAVSIAARGSLGTRLGCVCVCVCVCVYYCSPCSVLVPDVECKYPNT